MFYPSHALSAPLRAKIFAVGKLLNWVHNTNVGLESSDDVAMHIDIIA